MGAIPGSFGGLDDLTDAASAPAQPSAPFEDITVPPGVSFLTDNVPPPSPLYLDINDVIEIVTVSQYLTQGVTFSWRLLRTDGVIVTTSAPLVIDGIQTTRVVDFSLGEGWLLGIAIGTVPGFGGINRGTVYATAGIRRTGGNVTQMMLCGDYIATNYTVGWPGGPTRSQYDGRGLITSFHSNGPLAGQELTGINGAPGNVQVRYSALSFKLTTSATVANRIVTFTMNTAGAANPTFVVSDGQAQAASTTHTYSLSPAFKQATFANNVHMWPLPDCFMSFGGSFRTSTSGIQAGDQYTAVDAEWEQWYL